MKEKVIIGIPSGGNISYWCARSLLTLQKWEMENPNERYELLDIHFVSGLYIQENRNRLVKDAKELGADWLLQIDGDHSFDATLLRSIMRSADAKSRPVVAGLYANIGTITNQNFTILDCIYSEAENGQYSLMAQPDGMQPFQVDAAGTGIFLTHLSVFDKIEYPWFAITVFQNKDGSEQMMNEDLSFCRLARTHGYEIWCDPVAEATHWKTVPLLPSALREFLKTSWNTKKEMVKGK